MDTFIWNERFVTGIDSVDTQHRHLVDIVNRVGTMLIESETQDEDALQEVFKQLADYAHHHFADEENLMREAGLASAHQDMHAAHHRDFVKQLLSIWRARESMSEPGEIVHGFLAAWLTMHILGEDQVMARQIFRIRQGATADQAFHDEEQSVDSGTSALLTALSRLYHLLSQQNHNLAEANQHLEEKVAARTEELSRLLHKVEEAQQQLLQSEKMAAIGQLAAGIAHEINNPVGFVQSNLSTLKDYASRLLTLVDAYESALPNLPAQDKTLAAVQQAADLDFLREDLPALLAESEDGLSRVTKIVRDLKDFSHIDEAQYQLADLNLGLESTLNVVWNELKYKAEVIRDYGELPRVRCVPAQINQVFMNLLVNAAQAIEDRGTITVRSGQSGGDIWIDVADTGKGMTPEVQKRIFEPFFTTKPVGKGTGLGLSISYDIVVKKHGGSLTVDSQPGKGSTFRVTLPIAGGAAQAGT